MVCVPAILHELQDLVEITKLAERSKIWSVLDSSKMVRMTEIANLHTIRYRAVPCVVMDLVVQLLVKIGRSQIKGAIIDNPARHWTAEGSLIQLTKLGSAKENNTRYKLK